MNYQPPPRRPPFNDQLYQALSPIKQTLSDKQRLENVMRKYGRELPKSAPPARPVQWEGDPNG